jgi:hypothetical protein
MTGYVRNDTTNQIADGNVINASPLNGEFNALAAAFDGSTGHEHDGTTGDAPKINLTNATAVTGTLPIANGGTGSTSTTFVNLAANVTGTLPVANGGTGAATFTANNVLLGNGTSAFQAVAPGTSGNVLTSNGTTWTSAANPGITTGKAIAVALVFG